VLSEKEKPKHSLKKEKAGTYVFFYLSEGEY